MWFGSGPGNSASRKNFKMLNSEKMEAKENTIMLRLIIQCGDYSGFFSALPSLWHPAHEAISLLINREEEEAKEGQVELANFPFYEVS